LTNRLFRWLDKLQPPESVVQGGAGVVVGLGTGLGVWLFKRLIDVVHVAAFDGLGGLLAPLGQWGTVLIPTAGGVIVGLIVHFFIQVERHHGVAGIIESVALAGGRLRYRRLPIKAIASGIAIGFGASVGPEDPSVQIGANAGSMVGQVLRLSDDRIRGLVAAGCAAGIAAAFNAPIAGVFFALEIILGELSGTALGVTMLAAVISAVLTQALSGPQPAFRVPAYAFNSEWELLLYLGLGLVAGPVSALYVRLLYAAHDIFHNWKAPRWAKPIIGGLIVGLVGVWLPQTLGVGYDSIDAVLNGQQLVLGLLLALLAAKIILTPISLASGFLGGTFAPALFLGAMLGGAYGVAAKALVPSLDVVPAAFAMVGMAAVLAGAVHAPLTAIILLFEMTNDYHIILPLMFAVVVSVVVSQLIEKNSLYAISLARKGIQLQRGRDIELLESISVEEVMQTKVDTLPEGKALDQAAKQLTQTRHHGLPVVNRRGRLIGIITIGDIQQARLEGGGAGRTVGEVCTRDMLVTYPDENIGQALRRMSVRDIGRLPVVSRDDEQKLLGLLRRSDVIRSYELALTKRASMRHRAHQVRLGAVSGVDVREIVIEPGAPCADKHVGEVTWPRDCVLASLRRKRRVLLPHGDTILHPGDVLVAVVEGEAGKELNRLCSGKK
jgi:CIC family chloride channel protein